MLVATAALLVVGITAALAARVYAPVMLVGAIAAAVWFVYVTRRMTAEMQSRGRPRWLRGMVVLLTVVTSAGGVIWVFDMKRHPAGKAHDGAHACRSPRALLDDAQAHDEHPGRLKVIGATVFYELH
ncbi:MAG: hypothetical protein QOJ67_4188 [Acidimicrobiaceae bacterium]